MLQSTGTQQGLQMFEHLAVQIGGGLPPALHAKVLLSRLINQEAMILAFNDCFGVFVLIALIGMVLVLFFRRARPPVQQRGGK